MTEQIKPNQQRVHTSQATQIASGTGSEVNIFRAAILDGLTSKWLTMTTRHFGTSSAAVAIEHETLLQSLTSICWAVSGAKKVVARRDESSEFGRAIAHLG